MYFTFKKMSRLIGKYSIRSLYRAIKQYTAYLLIRPVFPVLKFEKNPSHLSTKADSFKVLVVHSGYSCQRHFNNLEAIIELLKHEVGGKRLDLHILSCDGAVKACGFYYFYPEQVNAKKNIPHSACERCKKNHRRRMGGDAYNHVSLKSLLDEEITAELQEKLRAIEKYTSFEKLRNYEIAGVRIGHLVIESIQRSLLETTHECYDLSEGTIAYEYFRSAIIYALISDKLFRGGGYDLAIGNEVSYIEWGIPALFALKHKTQYVHQSHHYPGTKHLVVTKHQNVSSLSWPPYVPTPEIIGKLCEKSEYNEKYKEIGKKELDRFVGEGAKIDVLQRLVAELGSSFDSSRRNIFVFTHLCWDGAQSFGDPIYESFELWLLDILRVSI